MLIDNTERDLLNEVLTLTFNNPKAIHTWMPKIEAIASHCKSDGKSISSEWLKSVYDNTIFNKRGFHDNLSVLPDICRCFQHIVPYLDDFNDLSQDIYSVATMLAMPGDTVKSKGVIPCGYTNYEERVKDLIRVLLDICVPSDFVDDIVEIIFSIDSHDPIQRIVKENGNLSFMKDLSIQIDNSAENVYYIRSMQSSVQKIVLYIIDIYSNPEIACDVFTKFMHWYYINLDRSTIYDFSQKMSEFGYEDGNYDTTRIVELYMKYKEDCAVRIAAYFYEAYQDKMSNRYFMSYIGGLLSRCHDLLSKRYNMSPAESTALKLSFDRIPELLAIQYTGGNILIFGDEDEDNIATEGMDEVKRNVTLKVSHAKNKISNAYVAYKRNEERVDDQLTKMIKWMKNKFIGDTKVELIEGKKFSVISILKAALASAALFHYSKIKFLLAIILRKVLRNKSRRTERAKLKMEIEEEIEILNEKIQDAASDGNREAKYAMMRTKKELENALTRLKIGIEADDHSIRSAKDMIYVNRGGGNRDVSPK